MRQDSVEIIYKQLMSYYILSFLYHIYTFLFSTIDNKIKLDKSIYKDSLAGNFYPKAIQL